MSVFTAEQVVAAVKAANEKPMPLADEGWATAALLRQAIHPACEALPEGHDCPAVRLQLEAMFLMGLGTGVELGRAEL